jgi:hypothetical protein
MAEPLAEDLQAQLQAYLNCLELCRALHTQSDEPSVREKLVPLMDGLQELLATLAGRLRQRGVPPGDLQLDRQGEARIREVLGMRSQPGQLRVVRECLADMLAWYAAYQGGADWLVPLSAQAQEMLEAWDQGMREVKATW